MDKPTVNYKTDFYAWLRHNAQLMRQSRFLEVDVQHITEELESIGRLEKRELINLLATLIAHLLIWLYQSEKRSYSWECAIKEQRKKIVYLFRDSPSLKNEIDEELADAYEIAVLKAAQETNIKVNHFLTTCPFTLVQLMDDDFYPNVNN